MDNKDYLSIAKDALFRNAKTRTGQAFPIGTTPMEAKAQINNLNEIDIAFTQTTIKIKVFYDKITASNNSSPFYLEVKIEELDMWVKACKEFTRSGNVFDTFRKKKTSENTKEQDKGSSGW